ncbi:MAG: hypothetical protein MUF49_20730 [Oculatellaceae cyanobacterium Prado106]|nr:hypothetical protein [Oculatellaceae cyanobacterium Prado106]
MTLGASFPAQPSTCVLPFDEVAQELSQEQNLIRIKKLLVYVCTQAWEGDAQRLEQVTVRSLLQDLRAIAPTVEHLQAHLDQAVWSLSKAAEYMLVANLIMSRMGKLYPERDGGRGRSPEASDYGIIAQLLEQNPDITRIKKLLVLACTNVWVSDAQELDQFQLVDLVQSLHKLTSSLEVLTAVLDSLVSTLSKRAEYALVAEQITQAFQSLYQAHRSHLQADEEPEHTMILSAAPVVPMQALVPQPEVVSVAPAVVVPTPDLKDLCNVRLEVMRYANPLRVKILLFSLLHKPLGDFAEWGAEFKNSELDELLRSLIQSHPRLSEIESKFKRLVMSLDCPDEIQQAAYAIVRAIQPFYPNATVSSMPEPTADLEDVTQFTVVTQGKEDTTFPESSLIKADPIYQALGMPDITSILSSLPN